jgi:hypothetical protein
MLPRWRSLESTPKPGGRDAFGERWGLNRLLAQRLEVAQQQPD